MAYPPAAAATRSPRDDDGVRACRLRQINQEGTSVINYAAVTVPDTRRFADCTKLNESASVGGGIRHQSFSICIATTLLESITTSTWGSSNPINICVSCTILYFSVTDYLICRQSPVLPMSLVGSAGILSMTFYANPSIVRTWSLLSKEASLVYILSHV